MKPLVFLGLMILLISSPGGMSSATMYWDNSVERDATITDADFDAKLPGTPPSGKSVKLYDTYQLPSVDSLDEDEGEAAQPVRRIRSRAGDASLQTPRINRTRTRPANGPRRTIAPAEPRSEPVLDRPKPVDASPDRDLRVTPDQPDSAVESPGSGAPEKTDPPTTKRMPWGNVNVKQAEPREPKEKKLPQWGQKK
jgi:hypothetical protein